MYSLDFEIVLLSLLTIKYLGFWLVISDKPPEGGGLPDVESAASRRGRPGSAPKSPAAAAEPAASEAEVCFKAYICASPPSLSKVVNIVKAMPSYLKPEMVQLMPTLLHVSEHTNAAGALLDEVAAEVRANPSVDVSLRLAVFAALG